MKRSVDAEKYNRQYFTERYLRNIDYARLESLKEFERIYHKTGNMLELKNSDQVVDLGCGIGSLAFYLCIKYGCQVIGVDYSPDAIRLCRENLAILAKKEKYAFIENKINFLLSDLENLRDFSGITAVYMTDVVEHLYAEELDLILEKIKKWGGNKDTRLVIHTDNRNYLRFIQPVINFISLCLGKADRGKIKADKKFNQERHVSLTTPSKLRKKLEVYGFRTIKLEYPEIEENNVKNQLGLIGKYRLIFWPVYFLGKLFYFLRPSFYLLAKYNKNA